MIDQGGSEDVRIGHERHQIRSKRGIAVLVSRYMPLENNAARTWVVLDLVWPPRALIFPLARPALHACLTGAYAIGKVPLFWRVQHSG